MNAIFDAAVQPTQPFHVLLAYNYILADFALLGFPLIVMAWLPRSEWRWKSFLAIFPIFSVVGLGWCLFLEQHDPSLQAWTVPTWASLGTVWKWSTEDFVFNFTCSFFFYAMYRLVAHFQLAATNKTNVVAGGFLALLGIALTALSAISVAALSLLIVFWLPSVLLSRFSFNSKKLLLVVALGTTFESIWDYVMVSVVKIIHPGCAGWIYLWKTDYGYSHSNVFASFHEHGWAWVLQNPIEITPGLGLAGSLFVFMMINAADALFYRSQA